MRRAITRALDKNVGWGMEKPLRGGALTQSCGNHITIWVVEPTYTKRGRAYT
jgi:hypothetical protein